MDLHTHLDLYPNALNILEKVNRENRFTLAVTTSPKAWVATSNVFQGYKNIKVGLGLHPEIALQKYNELELLLSLISKVKFVGEIGIDGSARFKDSLLKQEVIFESAIQECEEAGGRIISIHSRAAASKVLSILQKYPSCGKPILHWFTGSVSELERAIEFECFFSVNPLMIRSQKGRRLISKMPKSSILPESDGPFATQRGKPIMPWEALDICNELSEIWSVSFDETKLILNRNLDALLEKDELERK